jgi:hypothetical protein
MPNRGTWNAEREQELRHLAKADGYLAELSKRILRQRQIVEAASVKGRPSIEAESLLRALEESRRTLEKHRQLLIDLLENRGARQAQVGRRNREKNADPINNAALVDHAAT